jgi:hypothetical protein
MMSVDYRADEMPSDDSDKEDDDEDANDKLIWDFQ